ncbi:MAG: sel1 repeat family protein, partial [Methylobacteriaceae bacterium]|nr:sel1 repeat family protein [Methylobacteriaceae bacterium]
NLADEATGFLEGSGGKPRDQVEAAYWLRRAIAQPNAGTADRASSLTRLGSLYAESKRDTLSARLLWQIAGALGSFDALCDLGNLAADGDNLSKPDPDQAKIWYDRARQASCATSDRGSSDLHPEPGSENTNSCQLCPRLR